MPDVPAILDHVAPAMLVVFRLGGLTIYGPVLGSPVIPVRVKVLLTVMLGAAAYPLVGAQWGGQPLPRLELWMLAPLLAGELLIGLVIGFLASLPLMAMQTGGLLMGQQMGLGFAQLFNPAIDDEADVIGQVLFFMALAGFLAIGGHEAMFLAVLGSFSHIPAGSFAADASIIALTTGALLASLEMALRVAAPLVSLIFLESIALGFVSRTVPQLNILSLGFPLRIIAGLTIIVLGLVVIHEVMIEGMDEMVRQVFAFVDGREKGSDPFAFRGSDPFSRGGA